MFNALEAKQLAEGVARNFEVSPDLWVVEP